MQLTLKKLQIDSLAGEPLLNIDDAEFHPSVCALTGGNGAGMWKKCVQEVWILKKLRMAS